MFRKLFVKNDAVLGKLLKRNTIVRIISTQAIKKLPTERILLKVYKTQKPTIWSVNFCRPYSSYPSHTRVTLPALSPTMEKGNIISWEKKVGDKLNEGDLLAEIETDKATMGFETPEEGYLAKILIEAGSQNVPIGKLVCIIVENEEDIAAFKDFKDDSSAPSPAAAAPVTPPSPPAAAPVTPPSSPSVPSSPSPQSVILAPVQSTPNEQMTAVQQRGERAYASPMAKKLAEAQSLRLEGKGSGIYGSIKSSDLAGMQPSSASAKSSAGPSKSIAPQGGYIDIPVTNIRSVIAKRLLESKVTIPHFYLTIECQVDKIMKLRSKINKKHEKEGIRVSINDFIIKATAIACRKVPESNSQWMESVIRQFDNVDVSVAVSTDSGLITPIVFNADRKGVIEISSTVKELASKARAGKLQAHEFQGGTVTVSNLGMFGTQQFCAVINPPQSCILAIGTTQKKLILDPDSLKGFKEINTMMVTLSCDHRTVDGAVGAEWLKYFQCFIENPEEMIL